MSCVAKIVISSDPFMACHKGESCTMWFEPNRKIVLRFGDSFENHVVVAQLDMQLENIHFVLTDGHVLLMHPSAKSEWDECIRMLMQSDIPYRR